MSIIAILIGALGGAGLMYLLDPEWGRRRRALLCDQLVKVANRSGERLEGLSKDVPNRAKGAVLEAQKRIQHEEVDDAILVERVRSRMGRVASHPGAIKVMAENGRVTLSGPVLADEVAELLNTVRSVPGVKGIDNQLLVHQEAGNLPDLQG